MPCIKAIFLLFTSCLFVKNNIAQKVDTLSPYFYHDTNRVNKNYGSAKQLKGKTLIINCFISAKRSWKKEEKDEVLAMQQEGLMWVQQQANNWNISGLSFIVSNIGYDNDIHLSKIENNEEPSKLNVTWVPLVLNSSGYMNIPAFYDSVKKVSAADNVVVLIFAKQTGRSYAQPASSDVRSNEKFLEGAVIYYENYSGHVVTSATITHETLHLFGAKDIYKSRTKNEDAEQKMRSVFSRSIMLDTHQDIKPLFIEQFTAWCIGWTKSYWGWYSFFNRQSSLQERLD